MAGASFTDSGPILKSDQVGIGSEPASIPVGALPQRRARAGGPDLAGEPEVKFTKAADGTVEQITVRCPCGREVTLQCEYPVRGGENAKQTR